MCKAGSAKVVSPYIGKWHPLYIQQNGIFKKNGLDFCANCTKDFRKQLQSGYKNPPYGRLKGQKLAKVSKNTGVRQKFWPLNFSSFCTKDFGSFGRVQCLCLIYIYISWMTRFGCLELDVQIWMARLGCLDLDVQLKQLDDLEVFKWMVDVFTLSASPES